MNATLSQAMLFGDDAADAPDVITGAHAGQFGPAASDATLAGDGFGWLAALLPAPPPPACGTCGQPMTLPPGAPVLWACPSCYPGEAAA